jgi:hypothetical protein
MFYKCIRFGVFTVVNIETGLLACYILLFGRLVIINISFISGIKYSFPLGSETCIRT